MSFVSSLANVLTGGVAGGITGVIGAISSAIANYKLKKLEYEHQEKMTQLQMDVTRVKGDVALKVAEAKSKAEVNMGEIEAWKASYANLDKSYFDKSYFQYLPDWIRPVVGVLFAFLDFIRGSVRPVLAFYATIAISFLTYKTYLAAPSAFVNSADKMVSVLLYIATTIISWYFGNRELTKLLEKQHDKGC